MTASSGGCGGGNSRTKSRPSNGYSNRAPGGSSRAGSRSSARTRTGRSAGCTDIRTRGRGTSPSHSRLSITGRCASSGSRWVGPKQVARKGANAHGCSRGGSSLVQSVRTSGTPSAPYVTNVSSGKTSSPGTSSTTSGDGRTSESPHLGGRSRVFTSSGATRTVVRVARSCVGGSRAAGRRGRSSSTRSASTRRATTGSKASRGRRGRYRKAPSSSGRQSTYERSGTSRCRATRSGSTCPTPGATDQTASAGGRTTPSARDFALERSHLGRGGASKRRGPSGSTISRKRTRNRGGIRSP